MPLLEREAQLASLLQYADDARRGDGRLVLVAGEPGIGKSALVEGLQGELPDAHWLWGACDGMFTPRPLAPLHDIAEQVGGDLLEVTRSDGPRETLFGEVLRHLGRVDRLTVVVVEDVHWADEATLDLLRVLARRVRHAPVLVVVTYRDDGLGASEPLRVVLGELVSHRSTRRVGVPPLSAEAVASLSAESGVPADELYRLTGGNPFFVREVLRAGTQDVPPSARDAVLARIAPLSAEARRVVESAALIGARVEPALLAVASPGSGPAVDELVDAGMMISEGAVLRFPHELMRVAVAHEVPAHRARSVHAAVLHGLIAGGCTDGARLAHHAEGAGDGEAVVGWASRAAAQAAAVGSHREAALQYERALRFGETAEPAVVADLCDALSHEQSLVDRWEDAALVAQRALGLWREGGDDVRESATLRFLSKVMWRLNRSQESHEYAEAALACVRHLGATPAVAAAYADLAAAKYHAWDKDAAMELTRESVRLAETLGLPGVLSDALNTQACVLGDVGGDWFAPMRRALDVAVASGLDDQAGRAYANLHTMLALSRRFAECDHYYREGSEYCEKHDIATYGTCLRSGQAEVLLETGLWDEALALSRRMLDNASISPANRLTPTLTIGRILGRRGDPHGLSLLDEAVAAADEAGWLVETLSARAETRWLAGDVDGAVLDLERVAGTGPQIDAWHRGLVATWQRRLAAPVDVALDGLPEPHRLSVGGDHEGAAREWDRLFSPFEAALALYDAGTEESLREALRRFESLGADAAAAVTRREMRRIGVRSVPTGARPTTRSNPAGLTPRELEVLALVCDALTNDEIADRLVISAKTVDHHVSSVLGKLGVRTRQAAATEAARLGLAPAPA
jgi:DNA-binding CsgD family transcriptional regulator/tetratricopeptide (TPR) repeat protein